jgi:prepilin-type N-terminal cleavage/methylation domain-containing protein
MRQELPIADCRLPIKRQGRAVLSAGNARGWGFTLIELLVVIAIMAILASFTMVVLNGISKTKYRSIANAELVQIENALEDFKAKYGVYPPSNANLRGMTLPPLYYELAGVTNNGTDFVTLDNSARIAVTQVPAALGVGGFVNCSTGSGEDAKPAKNFLQGLKQNRIGSVVAPISGGFAVSNLVTSVGGPDGRYMPLGIPNVNPFRYIYPGTNNPNSYDLYVQIMISGQTYLICNWSKEVMKNSPLP